MANRTTIATAGNVLPAALACLRSLGFRVSNEGRLCTAESVDCRFVAEDPLLLLGLAKLYEMRGPDWRPADNEVEEFLAFDAVASSNDRVDVWEDRGTVRLCCVTAFGEPVQLGVEEARDFAARLGQAIVDAG